MSPLPRGFPGRFITLEGIEGSGKTTQARLLHERLKALGLSCALAREPGGTEFGEEIREILLRSKGPDLLAVTEVLLFNAARAELVRKVIVPKLTEGSWVICERHVDSTLAYQGHGGGVDLDLIKAVNSASCREVRPDLTLLLDLDPGKAFSERMGHRNWDRMESRPIAFHERVREGFLAIAKSEPGRVKVIDASPPAEEVHEECLRQVLMLRERHPEGCRT